VGKSKCLSVLAVLVCSFVLAVSGCVAASPPSRSVDAEPPIGPAVAAPAADIAGARASGIAVASASTSAVTLSKSGATSSKSAEAKRIALTFDDGYNSANVNRLLDILEREHVRATFFPVASWVKKDPATFKRMSAQFEIGNHTVSHPVLTRLSDEAVRREIEGGVASKLFRPPYGAIDGRVRAIAQSLGYRVVMWDIDSRDWTGISPARVVANVVNNAGDGKIVLMHMGDSNTIAAVPQIIAQLRARGYTFVTVSELVART